MTFFLSISSHFNSHFIRYNRKEKAKTMSHTFHTVALLGLVSLKQDMMRGSLHLFLNMKSLNCKLWDVSQSQMPKIYLYLLLNVHEVFTLRYLCQYRIQMRNFCSFRCRKRTQMILQSCMRRAFTWHIVHLYSRGHIHAHAPKKNLKICQAGHEQLGDHISS